MVLGRRRNQQVRGRLISLSEKQSLLTFLSSVDVCVLNGRRTICKLCARAPKFSVLSLTKKERRLVDLLELDDFGVRRRPLDVSAGQVKPQFTRRRIRRPVDLAFFFAAVDTIVFPIDTGVTKFQASVVKSSSSHGVDTILRTPSVHRGLCGFLRRDRLSRNHQDPRCRR